MESQQESLINASLQSTREAMVAAKIAIESATDRLNKVECDVNATKSSVHEIKANAIRTEERLAVIQKNQELQAADMRSIRNSVVASILAAGLISAAGIAFTASHQSISNRTNSTENRR